MKERSMRARKGRNTQGKTKQWMSTQNVDIKTWKKVQTLIQT